MPAYLKDGTIKCSDVTKNPTTFKLESACQVYTHQCACRWRHTGVWRGAAGCQCGRSRSEGGASGQCAGNNLIASEAFPMGPGCYTPHGAGDLPSGSLKKELCLFPFFQKQQWALGLPCTLTEPHAHLHAAQKDPKGTLRHTQGLAVVQQALSKVLNKSSGPAVLFAVTMPTAVDAGAAEPPTRRHARTPASGQVLELRMQACVASHKDDSSWPRVGCCSPQRRTPAVYLPATLENDSHQARWKAEAEVDRKQEAARERDERRAEGKHVGEPGRSWRVGVPAGQPCV